jgi:hypothetical protein
MMSSNKSQYLYIGQTIYATEVFVTKICVTLFYLRIFPVPNVQRLLWGTVGLSVVCLVAFDVLAIAQCQPISFFWQGWDKLHEGHCIGVNPLGWAIAGVSIIMDFWMLGIPLFQLIKLQMKWQRKLAVACMFIVGTLYVPPDHPHTSLTNSMQCHYCQYPTTAVSSGLWQIFQSFM